MFGEAEFGEAEGAAAGWVAGVGGAELVALQSALDAERTRREVAEALAEERLQHIYDLRRMLPPPDPKPRRWWPFGSGGRTG